MKKVLAAAAFSVFVVAGPAQHAGVLPATAFGDVSNAVIASALDLAVGEALACGNGGGNGNSGGNGKGGGGGNGHGKGRGR